LFDELGLTTFDPQEAGLTKDDEAYVAALRDAAEAESAVDDEQIALWRREAAHGDTNAMNELGNCYSSGEGVERNTAEAVAWFRKAAEGGHIPAELNLIQCYLDGDGVAQDLAEARARYERLVVREQCMSAFALGEMYANGIGGPASRERAIEMFTLARMNRHPGAYLALKALGAAPPD
jgi:TPR repeat protein